MNDPRNELAAWLKFYDDKNLASPTRQPFGYGVFGGGGEVTNGGPDRLAWAQSMMGQQATPDFFGDAQPANGLAPYMAPERFSGGIDDRPMRSRVADPMRPQIQNYLSRILGSR